MLKDEEEEEEEKHIEHRPRWGNTLKYLIMLKDEEEEEEEEKTYRA